MRNDGERVAGGVAGTLSGLATPFTFVCDMFLNPEVYGRFYVCSVHVTMQQCFALCCAQVIPLIRSGGAALSVL